MTAGEAVMKTAGEEGKMTETGAIAANAKSVAIAGATGGLVSE
jgi:hypothetical protein